MLVVVQILKRKKDDARRLRHLILNTGSYAFTFPNLSSPKFPHPIFFPTLQNMNKILLYKNRFHVRSDFRRSSPEVWPDHEYRGGGGGTPGGGHVGPGPA